MENPTLNRLMASLAQQELDGLVLNPGPSLYYITGLSFHLMERPVLLFLIPGHSPKIILTELEIVKLEKSKLELEPYLYGDDPSTWSNIISGAIESLELEGKKIGVESLHLRFMELSFLRKALPKTQFVSAASILDSLRICKQPEEIRAIIRAVKIAESALLNTIPFIRIGISEKEIASELTLQLIKAGSEPELSFKPIVASGPNSANPHAEPSDRLLQVGDMLVIDWGARVDGYISDLTRTFCLGKMEPEFEKIYDLVLSANTAGRAAAHAGITAGTIDQAARRIISDGGYGPYFTHRTGHGIGLEAHEPPYIFGENDLILTPGMCFTVEPGIYLAGRNGVRIEDNIVITADGVESLSTLPRELQIIG